MGVASVVGVALSLLLPRLREAFAALHTAVRNVDIRRAELAWGASVSAEWAHFVALGVFAYGHGGSTAVGIAGLMRLLPAAAIAPFASSLGDRFRREWFLLGLALLGAAALVLSAVGALMGDRVIVFVAASVVGICSTLFRPALDRAPPHPRAHRARTDRRERSDLDDREPRHPAWPACRRCAGRVRQRRRGLRRRRSGSPGGCGPAGPRVGAGARARDRSRSRSLGGLPGDRGGPARTATRGADRFADVRPRVPERPDRRDRVPGARRGGNRGGIPYGRNWGRRPRRRTRRDLAARRTACAALRLGLVFWGSRSC